jgi:hypothetical protein
MQKSNMIMSVNNSWSLSLLIVVLSLISLTSTVTIEVSKNNFGHLENTEYKVISNAPFNLGKGSWFKIELTDENNHDNRILEFHAEKNGFLNTYAAGITGPITQQIFLYSPVKVLVFYSDKKPSINYGMSTQQSPISLEEVGKVIAEQVKKNKDYLKLANFMPYANMKSLFNSNANKLLNFPTQLKFEMDKRTPLLNEQYYHVEFDYKKYKAFYQEIMGVMFDFMLLRDKEVFYNLDYRTKFKEQLKAHESRRNQFIDQDMFLKLRTADDNTQYLKEFYDSVVYFTKKLVRNYLFSESSTIWSDTFNNFQPGKSKFSSNFFNLDKIDPMNILKVQYFSLMTAEYPFDHFESIINKQDDIFNEHLTNKYFGYRFQHLYDSFQNVYKLAQPFLKAFNSQSDFPEIEFNNYYYMNSFLNASGKGPYEPILRKHTTLAYAAMKNFQPLLENNFSDLSSTRDSKFFRQYMTVIGYIPYDYNIDSATTDYEPTEFFKIKNRIVLL